MNSNTSVLVRLSDNKAIAFCDRLPSGKIVDAAFSVSAEAIDANREYNLVNAFRCKVSNAKTLVGDAELPHAEAINGSDDEFYV